MMRKFILPLLFSVSIIFISCQRMNYTKNEKDIYVNMFVFLLTPIFIK